MIEIHVFSLVMGLVQWFLPVVRVMMHRAKVKRMDLVFWDIPCIPMAGDMMI
jgi:hypothetical protein